MRLNEVFSPLLEDTESVEGDVLADFIRENCQPFLKLKPNPLKNALLRGIRGASYYPSVVDVLQNREPVDISINVQYGIDDELKKRGFVARRGNSIYCTGDYSIATGYGAVYMVFPIGDFSFTWSKAVLDLVRLQDDILTKYGLTTKTGKTFDLGRVPNKKLANSEGVVGNFDKIVDDLEYQTSDFDAAIQSGHEILINCQKVLYVPYMDSDYRREIASLSK